MALPAPAAALTAGRLRVALGGGVVAALAVVAAASWYGALARADAVPAAPPSGATSIGAIRQLALEDGGLARPLAAGEPVELGRDVVATLRLVDAGGGSEVLFVQLADATGSPLRDATVRAVLDMRFMEHGRADVLGMPTGPGTYAVPLALAMPGEWRVTLEVATASTTVSARLDFDDYR